MSDFPPLPRYLTLEEAAQALTDRTGKAWTPRQILGCAERHEISVFARIGHAVKFVRVKSIEGRTNEITADAGSLPLLDTEAIRALLLAGEAHSRGWEELTTVDFFGEPAEVWQKVFELTPGVAAPIVRPDVCRVTAAGVLQLVEAHNTQPAPAQSPATAAPVVAASDGPAPPTAAWSLKPAPARLPGYRWPLYQVLKAAHDAGKPYPKAQHALDAWKLKPQNGIEVIQKGRNNELRYELEHGGKKTANLKAIQAAIDDLID